MCRLRDVTSEQEADLNKKIKSLEKELVSLQDIQGYYIYIFKGVCYQNAYNLKLDII